MVRLFEMVPGILSWATLLGLIFLSWQAPFAVAIFIIVFDTYWLFKTLYLSLHLRSSFRRMREYQAIPWLEKLKTEDAGRWEDIRHLVILPMYKEAYEVVRESFLSLSKTNFPKDRLLVVLATEARGGEGDEVTAQKIRNEFQSQFPNLIVTVHPKDIEGELAGKGSNETWAAQEAKRQLIDSVHYSYERVLVSVFDVDTQVYPEYFGRLTHAFIHSEKPLRSSFQPIPLFTNNIYHTPAFGRVVAFSATFWQMMQQARPERLTTFSSHAMPFSALVDIGYWQTDVVSEDSRIFWQCYLHYDGDWRTEPLFYPVSMDANTTSSFKQTIINIYKQQRRWSYGAENIPYLLEGFVKNPRIPFKSKLYWSFNILESFHSWATNVLIIFALGWLPVMIGGRAFDTTLLAYKLPEITGWIVRLSGIGIVSSAILSLWLLPPRPKDFRQQDYSLYLIQWLLMPVTLIVFGAFPALEAQTRLILGGKWRLGFWVTPKSRLEKPHSK